MFESSKKLYVVGDKFKDLTNFNEIVTFSTLIEMLTHRKVPPEINTLSIEQGINEANIADIKKIITHKELTHLNIQHYFENVIRCENNFSHKHQTYNTLISSPEKIAEEQYFSRLLVDETCADLSDHVTGKHLQFMVLLEAARQMGNAVTEKYYADNSTLYLANKISSEFKSFVYPFSAELIYQVKDKKIKGDGNGKMSVQIEVVQWGKTACEFLIDFTILKRDFVTALENSALKAGISNLVKEAVV